MIIPINSQIRINSEPTAWVIETRPASGKGQWKTRRHYSQNEAFGLRNALNDLGSNSLCLIEAPHPTELAQVPRVLERLWLAEHRIRDVVTTRRRHRELAPLGIAIEVGGYRFDFNDPFCVHRQVRRADGEWESKSYFNNLAHALVYTFYNIVRRSDAVGFGDVASVIHQTEIALRKAKDLLPALYFSAESADGRETADPQPENMLLISRQTLVAAN